MPELLEIPKHAETMAPKVPSPRGAMLLRVLGVLAREKVPYCILHGYEKYPFVVDGDVDCLVSGSFLPRKLAKILHENREEIGARIVQWFEDAAHFIALAGRDSDGSPVILQLHVSSCYEMAGRVFFEADEILASRSRRNGFWAPAPDVEFACILINKLCKGQLSAEQGRRLTTLYLIDATRCAWRACRLLEAHGARMVLNAAASGNWQAVRDALPSLRRQLVRNPESLSPDGRLARLAGKIRRWLRPRNGFHAVFLGPDGVGKSTVIETFSQDLSPVFLSSTYLTFAPGLLPRKFAPPKPQGPHSLPPRSLAASLLKAAWWAVCYTVGYSATVRPALARGGLVVNHRYLVDAIVDPKRYRYSGPAWLLKLIWAVSPRPDVVFLLDADPQVIQRRKQEVPPEETARQVQAYRNVIRGLPGGQVIDASQSRKQVAAEAEWLVLDRLAQRVARQFSFGASS